MDQRLGGIEDIKPLNEMCKAGRLFDVQDWVSTGQPLQISEHTKTHHTYRSALGIAVGTGQLSLAELLLESGYDPNLDHECPVSIAIGHRRQDIAELLLAAGADVKRVNIWRVFGTYDSNVYQCYYDLGVDFTEHNSLADELNCHPSNKPLWGFCRRNRSNPAIQMQLDIALGAFVERDENEKGVALALWAGANPHSSVPELGYPELSRSAVERAAYHSCFDLLKRFGPDPELDDFDALYAATGDSVVIEYLSKIKKPSNISHLLSWQASKLEVHRAFQYGAYRSALCDILPHLGPWASADPDSIKCIRRSLLKCEREWAFTSFIKQVRDPKLCDPDIFLELIRTPAMQKRLLELKLIKPVLSEKEKRKREIERLLYKWDREKLHRQVWERAVTQVAKDYGVSGNYLGRVCRILKVPVPPRGYWSKLRNGKVVRKKPLPKLC